MVDNQYVKASAMIITANIISKLFSIISSVLLLRFFAPNELGIFDLGLTIILVGLPLFTLNLTGVANVFVAGIKNPKKLVFNFLILYSALAILGVIVLFLIKSQLLVFFGANLGTYLFVVLITGFASLQYTFSLNILQTLRDYKLFFISSIGQSFVFLALILIDFYAGGLFISKYKITGLFITYLLSYLPFIILFFFKIGIQKVDFSILKKFFIKASRNYVPYLFGFAALFLLRLLVFRHSPIEVGTLRVYDYFTVVFTFTVSSLVTVLSPIISKGGHFSSNLFVSKGINHLLFVMSILSLVYFAAFTGVSHFLFGSKYDYTFGGYSFYILSFILNLTAILIFNLFSAVKVMFSKAYLVYGIAGAASLILLFLIPKTVFGYSLLLLLNGLILFILFFFDRRFAKTLKYSSKALFLFLLSMVIVYFVLTLSMPSLLRFSIGIIASLLVALMFFKTKLIDSNLLFQVIPSFFKKKN